MTFAQISAVIALLLAFNVPSNQVEDIRLMLTRAPSQPTQATAPIVSEVGGTVVPTQETKSCAPTIEASLKYVAGDVKNGLDYVLIATSTIPTGCSVNMADNAILAFPTITYKGDLSSWARNGQLKTYGNSLVVSQGYGIGENMSQHGSVQVTISSTTKSVDF